MNKVFGIFRFIKYNVIINIFLILIISYGFYWIILAAMYSHPNAEDFSLIGNAQKDGILNATIMLLNTYDGRYFTNILHGLNPLAFGYLEYHKYSHIFSIFFFIFSLYFFLGSFLEIKSKLQAVLLSSLILLVNLAISPSIVHELYWLVSSYVYFYCWIFWFLWVGFFLRSISTENQKQKDINFFFANILLFLSMGINEIFLVLNAFTLFFLLILDYNLNKNTLKNNLPIILSFVFSLSVFITSPGITNRLEMFSQEEDGFNDTNEVLEKSIYHYGLEALRIFFKNYLIIPIILLSVFFFDKINVKRVFNSKTKITFTLFVFMICGLYFSSFSYYLPVGTEETHFPKRIFTSVNTGFVLMTLIIVFLLKRNIDINNKARFFLNLMAIILAVYGLFYQSNNIKLIKKEYSSGILTRFDNEMKYRYSLIKQAKEIDSCWRIVTIQPLKNQPLSVFFPPDIYSNRKQSYWNRAYESYFLIEELRVKSDTVNKYERIMK